jgi:hypothetical protein
MPSPFQNENSKWLLPRLKPEGGESAGMIEHGVPGRDMPNGILPGNSKPMQATPTRQPMGNPNLTGRLHIPRTKYGSK